MPVVRSRGGGDSCALADRAAASPAPRCDFSRLPPDHAEGAQEGGPTAVPHAGRPRGSQRAPYPRHAYSAHDRDRSHRLTMSRVAPLLLLVLLCTGCGDGADGSAPRAFDAKVWLAHPDIAERKNPRWGMVSDVKSRLVAGKTTRADVIALLGPPSQERGTTLEYAVGWWGGAEMDANTFNVVLDAQGVVVRSQIHQH